MTYHRHLLTTSDIAFIRDNLHLPDGTIAVILGMSRVGVWKVRKRYGIERSDDNKAQMKRLHAVSEKTKEWIRNNRHLSYKVIRMRTGLKNTVINTIRNSNQ